ncbi:MAG: hypothetical protein CMJ83_02245, partial [Planctomycetes bacterium]|nr:hypothetical protein [Planctomycetota bacterium]
MEEGNNLMSTRLSLASTSIRSWAVLLVVGFALTACGGGGGGGGLGSDGPPAAPLGASVPASGSNPLNVVNSSNVAALFIDVVFGPESSSEHTVTVTIDDGGADGVVQATAQASEGAGTVSVGPMDLSSLDDGSLSVTAEVVSSQGSSGVIPMGTLAKQTTGYQTPIKSNVAALPSGQFPTGTAQLDVINSVNANQVTVAVEFGADSDSSLTAVLCLFDGVNTVSVPPFAAPEGAAIVNVGPLDATGLDEGSITLKVEITDGFGNPTTFPGDTAVKDTIVPTPSDVSVPSGDNNSEGWVNVATCNDATFLVHMPANSTFADLVTVNISDGSNIVTVGPLGSPAPKVGEQEQDTHEISFENVDLSSLSDGSLTITGQVEDDHGNLISFAHSPVSAGTPLPAKDTVAPTATSSLIAAGPNNPAGIINIASQSQVSVDVGVLGTSV